VVAALLVAAWFLMQDVFDDQPDIDTSAPATTDPNGPADDDEDPPQSAQGQDAADLLARLEIRDEGSRRGYDREDFGEGWTTDAHGCTTREQVLAEESKAPITRGSDGCSVEEGRWLSLYDGDVLRDPDDLQIDHMVPLAEAWDSGASEWDAERRERYANDMRRTGALLAVSSEMNQSKSDQDPTEWMPPDRGVWCRYVNAWIVQKHGWHLTIDQAEHDKLAHVLATC
jgi:hypothetical protein